MRNLKPPQKGYCYFRGVGFFVAGTTGIALLIFVYLAFTWRNFAGLTSAINAFTELFSDFVIYYYPMGEAIFQTEFPISGFLYSPFIALLLSIFPLLGYSVSLVLWGILQVLSIWIYLFLFRRLVPAGIKIQLLFVFLSLSSYPLLLNLLGGQVSVFMTLALLGLLAFNERSRSTAGAGMLAFAASFKFYPIVFLVPFAARRNVRFLLSATAACGVFLFVIPGILLGFGDTVRFYGGLLDSFRDSGWVNTNPHSQFFPHLILRLADAWGQGSQGIHWLLNGISIGVATVNIGLIFLIQRARLRYADLWSFQILFMTLPFILKTSWPHDFVFLSFTQALMLWRLLEEKKPTFRTDTAQKSLQTDSVPQKGKTVSLSLILPSIVISNIVFFNVFGDFASYGFFGFLFWANLLLLIATYIQFLPPALRRTRQIRAG